MTNYEFEFPNERICKSLEIFPPLCHFSCKEEFNNKFFLLSREEGTKFCEEVIKELFLRTKEDPFCINLLTKDERTPRIKISLGELLSKEQMQIKLSSKCILIGLYKNFIFQSKELILYFIQNIVHTNKEYILFSNESKKPFQYEDLKLAPQSYHLFLDKKTKDPKEKKNLKAAKNLNQSALSFESDGSVSGLSKSSTIIENIRTIKVKEVKQKEMNFQIILPAILIQIRTQDLSIDIEIESHLRIFHQYQIDVLINRFKVSDQNAKDIFTIFLD
jgi:hypothetical protein